MAKQAAKQATEQRATQAVELAPLRRMELKVVLEGTAPYVPHKWSKKARAMIRDKKLGQKAKMREVADPGQEAHDATYRMGDGRYGIPAKAFREAMHSIAHKDIGITKVAVNQGMRILADGFDVDEGTPLVAIIHNDEPRMREDIVRVGMGSADLRWRMEFAAGWRVELRINYDEDKLTPTTICSLLERAGFGVGVGEARSEKGGDWGSFMVAEQ
jgi:hypothetical protein